MASPQQFRVTKSGSRTPLKDEAEGSLSITQAAWLYAVSKTMLYQRLSGRQDQISYDTSKQGLTPRQKDFFRVTTSASGIAV